jgi:undecaprenyl-diphosphatase
MTWIEALILGLLQGLTEFLPVSSSGHLELGGAIFGLQDPESYFTFNVLVHGATFASVMVVFFNDIKSLLINFLKFKWNPETRFVLLLLASAVPVAIVGLLFEEQIESLFSGHIVLVGFMLLVTATLLFLTKFVKKTGKDLSLGKVILIGLAQTLAIIPGVSRSGATISTALFLGVDRQKAIKFSFLMALIPIFGANFLKIIKMSDGFSTSDIGAAPLIIGVVAAFVAGLIACKWMLEIVRKGNIAYFSIYCLIIGLAAIVIGSI